MRKQLPKKPIKAFGLAGPHAALDSSTLFDLITERAAAKKVSRYQYLIVLLRGAGFEDVPSRTNWNQWLQRKRIADVWLPTVLYAALVSGEKLTFREMLKVKQP